MPPLYGPSGLVNRVGTALEIQIGNAWKPMPFGMLKRARPGKSTTPCSAPDAATLRSIWTSEPCRNRSGNPDRKCVEANAIRDAKASEAREIDDPLQRSGCRHFTVHLD